MLETAKSLLAQDDAELDALALDESLRREIALGQRLSRGAKVRQARRIAKLLANDPEALAAIEQRLASKETRAHADRQRFKSLEKLREALLEGHQETGRQLEAQLAGADWRAIQSAVTDYHNSQNERARKTHYRSIFKRLASALASIDSQSPTES